MAGVSTKSDGPMSKTRQELLQQQVEARLNPCLAACW